MKYLFVVISILLGSTAFASDHPKLYAVIGVSADDALNIRTKPDAKAEVLGGFVHDASGVEVIALSEDGKWGQVNIGERSGWSSMQFLTPLPKDDPLWLSCFGVEPFWGIILDETGQTSEWSSPESKGKIGKLDPLVTTTALPRTFAYAGKIESVGDFQALMTYQSCSDTMSDNQYGLSIDLTMSKERHLSGCCTLQR